PKDEEPLEELDEYEDEVATESLDDAELEVEDHAAAAPEVSIEVDTGELEAAEAPAAELKPPPPPKRKVPRPPKKKEPRIGKEPRAPQKRRAWWEEVFAEDFARATHHLSTRHIKREV